MVWRQERQIDLKSQEGCPQRTVTYVYEPGSYVPLARIDSAGASAEQQIGTPRHFDTEAQAANSENYGGLNNGGPGGSGQVAGSGNATGSKAQLYYFHTDTAGLPQELSDAGGALRWRASYQTRGNTLKEDWQAVGLSGAALPEHLQQQQTDSEKVPQKLEQNLRFQGQYLDRSTGLHYNTFRYYDPDIGRFISPDPIGLASGDNLYQYAPNPVSWIDPWGWEKGRFETGKGQHSANVTVTDGSGKVISQQPFKIGNMTPAEKALGFPRSTLATHTEARAVSQVPLKSGQEKMQSAATNSDSTIKYTWSEDGVPKSKTWGGGC